MMRSDGTTIKTVYNNNHLQTRVETEGLGISQITDAIGRVITFTYSQSQVRVTAPDGRVWQYNLTASTASWEDIGQSQAEAWNEKMSGPKDPYGSAYRPPALAAP